MPNPILTVLPVPKPGLIKIAHSKRKFVAATRRTPQGRMICSSVAQDYIQQRGVDDPSSRKIEPARGRRTDFELRASDVAP
jgi:hypothetical protein